MNREENWRRLKTHRKRLSDQDIQGFAEVLFQDQEDWLREKLWLRDDVTLVFELLSCLGRAGSTKAAEILLEQLNAGEEVLQIAAAEALKQCPPILVLEPLTKIMQEQNPGSVKAGEILLSFGDEGSQALWQMWFGENRPVRLKSQILQLLTEARDDHAESLAFLAFLSGEEELVRMALKTAEELDTTSLWGNVAECLKSPGWQLRGKAAYILGRWKESNALVHLQDMGVDDDPWVEEERQKAMELLSESRA